MSKTPEKKAPDVAKTAAVEVAPPLVFRGSSMPYTIGGASRMLITGKIYEDFPADDPVVKRLRRCKALKVRREPIASPALPASNNPTAKA